MTPPFYFSAPILYRLSIETFFLAVTVKINPRLLIWLENWRLGANNWRLWDFELQSMIWFKRDPRRDFTVCVTRIA
jgi:hypothetical protein